MTEFTMRSNRSYPGRTYRFSRALVTFPFGAGLSYTNFFLSWNNVPSTCTTSQLHDGVDLNVTVTNVGALRGGKVVHAFASHEAVAGKPTPPIKTLFGINKVFLDPGESKTVSFSTKA